MQLGIVLTPYGQIPGQWPSGISYGYGGDGTFKEPYDPRYNTRGEAGFYHDTQMGGLRGLGKQGFFARMRARRTQKQLRGLGGSIPSDADLASTYGFLPFIAGSIGNSSGPAYVGPWTPPNGWQQGAAFGPNRGFSGLRDAAPTVIVSAPDDPGTSVPAAPSGATVDDVIAAMTEQNQKMFTLAVVSTTAMAISALLTIYRTRTLLKRGI